MMSQIIPGKRTSTEPKLFELLQNDLRKLSAEAKKRFPLIKEACEEGIVKLRNAQSNPQTPLFYVVNQILYPFVQGCETKDQKIVKICLAMIQRLITEQVVDQKAARCITETLWMLMESGTEEVKLLQSVTLLLTTNSVVHGDILAKNLVLCFRLHFAKDATTMNTAGATIRQLVSLVFERLLTECEANANGVETEADLAELRAVRGLPPKGLTPTAADAYLMFQDLVLLVNADQPCWMVGMTEMTRVFGLELLEMVLVKFSKIFYQYPHFSFLLKERVCALVIKLFSPNIKFRCSSSVAAFPQDKPNFAVSVRLCRVVEILVHRYQCLLVTECEIFLSLIVKFLDPDKPVWQRALALEVLHHLLLDARTVRSLCESYDLKTNSTNIFHDIVKSLGCYVQLILNEHQNGAVQSSPATAQPSGPLSNGPGGPGAMPQPGFFSRGYWYPLVLSNTGQARSLYMDMLEKTEPPVVPECYGVSVAYSCLLDLVNSLALAIADCPPLDENVTNSDVPNLRVQLVASSWAGVLTGVAPLIDSCTDEATTDHLLKAVNKFVGFCGALSLESSRDAFITAVCKACLPPQYSLNVFKPGAGYNANNHCFGSVDNNSHINLPGYGNESDYRQQVVAVGTPLPTASLPAGAHQGPVMLTSKNLQCMRALLDLAHEHGSVLVKAWHLVLTTLQHLVWILRLKPTQGGSLKAGKTPADPNAVITTAVMADLPVLSTMLSRLFESSQHLSDVSLHHLIHALCQLSQEAMELAYSNREPSLFAVAKLLETGLVNLHRIEVFWRPLTSHLLEVSQHPHIRMREWGVEAVTYLLKVALQYKYNPPLRSNQQLQTLILLPLSELSCVPHADVRLRQLECMLHVLHSSGETLCFGWPLVLNTIAAVSDFHGENLIRMAFQCLQLVVTDFLPVMPWSYLPHCVNTTAKFGCQTRELNISLTAVGLMWNVSDYFYQNYEKLTQSLSGDPTILPEVIGYPDMPAFDKLMMCLFTKLGDLCVDSRPAVRKSAGQTLFGTIGAHGGLLSEKTWQPVLCQVLFPLLDKVKASSSSASSEKVDTGSNILIHHSRNTAQKQWAETQVLTVLGVAKVFESEKRNLQKLGDFARFWSLFMEYLEGTALSHNDEVSLSALKAFQEILYWRVKTSTDDGARDSDDVKMLSKEEEVIRVNAWQVWLNVGYESTSEDRCKVAPPSQQFLTALMQIFPDVYLPIRSRFGKDEMSRLGEVLSAALLVPPHGENVFIMPLAVDPHISHLQDGVLDCVELIAMGCVEEKCPSNIKNLIDDLCDLLLNFIKLVNSDKSEEEQVKAKTSESTTPNFIPFVERAIEVLGWLYERVGHTQLALEGHVLEKTVKALRYPMCTKYMVTPLPSLWKLAASCFLKVLKIGLPLARQHPEHFETFWPALGTTLEEFLFFDCESIKEKGAEEWKADEAIDCHIVELIRDQVLRHYSQVPREFLLQVVVLLNMGSMHSASDSGSYLETATLREDLAKVCFETLLEFSLMGSEGSPEPLEKAANPESAVVGRLAVTSLLHRFQTVLQRFIEDDALAGKCPLPRYQVSEVSFVLKAVTSLVQSLKNAPPEKVGKTAWQQLIDLYPCLVNCVTTTSPDILAALKEALLQYSLLLRVKGS